MINYSPCYCIETDERGRRYRRSRKGTKFDLFAMKTAVIAYDSHDNFIIGTLFYEPLHRGLSGGLEEAKRVALEMQPDIERFEIEYNRYITRTGFVVTLKKDVYLI